MAEGKTNYEQEHLQEQQTRSLLQYVKSVSIMNKLTANEYNIRLLNFEKFLLSQYNIHLDKFVEELKKDSKKYDVYEVLGNYSAYLFEESDNPPIQTTTLKQRVVTAKNFLEFHDIDIIPRKFKLKIKFPRNIKRNKEALDKSDIINILNGCSEIKLKTYVMLLATTGMRATEALSIRLQDIDFESSPTKLTVRGEYTKTKTDRYVFLTKELTQQLTKWIDYKYRKRRVCSRNKITGELIDEYRTPEKKIDDLIFSIKSEYNKHNNNNRLGRKLITRSRPNNTYFQMAGLFAKTLDRIGMGSREESNKRRRKITLHSFRRFVKTTISDLGYSDYSEWFIGHSGSTYWRKKDSEKAEIFKKIESYLTFLNVPQLERQGADLQTKIEELQIINQSLRHNDKVKEDALANLSDQLLVLSERIQQLERKQLI